MKIFAHRGYTTQYPENSMPAFQMAYAGGADGIELDVHLSRDRQIIIIHDESLSRTVDGVGFIRHHTLRDLQNYTLKSDAQTSDPLRLITLQQYLDWAKDKPLVTNIELKNDRFRYPGLEEEVVRAVQEREMQAQVILSTFRAESVRYLKTQWPELRVGWLISAVRGDTLKKAREIHADFIHPNYREVDETFVRQWHAAGFGVHPYTVNSEGAIRRMLDLGVDAILTDALEQARAVLGLPPVEWPEKGLETEEEAPAGQEEEKEEKKAPAAQAVEAMAHVTRRLRRSQKGMFRGGIGEIFGIFAAMAISIALSTLVGGLVLNVLKRFWK